jgi:hypothetical protein
MALKRLRFKILKLLTLTSDDIAKIVADKERWTAVKRERFARKLDEVYTEFFTEEQE